MHFDPMSCCCVPEIHQPRKAVDPLWTSISPSATLTTLSGSLAADFQSWYWPFLTISFRSWALMSVMWFMNFSAFASIRSGVGCPCKFLRTAVLYRLSAWPAAEK